MAFEFTSVNGKKEIHLAGVFIATGELPNLFNFGFGEIIRLPYGGIDIDDKVNLHNGDMDKIFNTVANEIYRFISKYPSAIVSIKGSDLIRIRKYQQLLSKNYGLISKYFVVYAYQDVSTQPIEYVPNTPNCLRFLILKK